MLKSELEKLVRKAKEKKDNEYLLKVDLGPSLKREFLDFCNRNKVQMDRLVQEFIIDLLKTENK